METPSLQLATRIFERLLQEGLLKEGDRKKLLTKLGEGKIKQEDWRLALELSSAGNNV